LIRQTVITTFHCYSYYFRWWYSTYIHCNCNRRDFYACNYIRSCHLLPL
jgi:hypothetical protein